MRLRRTARALIAAAIAPLALIAAGCGEKPEPVIVGPPAGVTTGEEPTRPTGIGQGGVELEQVGTFSDPVFVTQPRSGDRALYVVEQAGRVIRVLPDGSRQKFLDISKRVSCCGERGLLSLAFSPDYARNGLLYIDYTDKRGNTRVVELRRKRKGPGVDLASARELLRVRQPFANHNGGLVMFGPDRQLYIGLGDGGSAGDPLRTGQDLGTLLGKILRINPRPSGKDPYRIPLSNPFAAREGAQPEIVVYGVRNPWRFSFDNRNGALWIGDVGQAEAEEIDYVPSPAGGANLGWSAYEGDVPFNEDQEAKNALAPVFSYGHDEGCAVTGGYVVRDPALETLYGRYLYSDFCQGQLRSFSADDALPGPVNDDVALGVQVPSIISFGEDAEGRVYAVSLEGPVYRLVPSS